MRPWGAWRVPLHLMMVARFLITGASEGVGLELCQMLAARGDQVIACCRRPSPALLHLGVRIEAGVDLRSPDSMADLALQLRGARLDGILIAADAPTNIEQQFQLLTMGPVRLVRALLRNVAPGARILIIDQAGSHSASVLSELAVELLREELAGFDVEVMLSQIGAHPKRAAETTTPMT